MSAGNAHSPFTFISLFTFYVILQKMNRKQGNVARTKSVRFWFRSVERRKGPFYNDVARNRIIFVKQSRCLFLKTLHSLRSGNLFDGMRSY